MRSEQYEKMLSAVLTVLITLRLTSFIHCSDKYGLCQPINKSCLHIPEGGLAHCTLLTILESLHSIGIAWGQSEVVIRRALLLVNIISGWPMTRPITSAALRRIGEVDYSDQAQVVIIF